MICARHWLAAALLIGAGELHAADRHRIALPPGPLGQSVIALAGQAGVSIGITDPALARRPARAVSGTMTVREALARLLAGTGARAEAIDARTFRIVAAPARRAPAPRPAPAPPPPSAPAADSGPDIVVTGLKRPYALRDVPGTVDVIDTDDPMIVTGVRGTDALLGRLHTVTSTHYGPGRNKLFIRGIADSSFNGPTQATVGQYLGETRLNYNAPDPDLRLYDIERVEVLTGPQGTLYGAGSLGGIIRTLPAPPELDALEGAAALGLSVMDGGDAGLDGAAMLNLPVAADRLALRLVGYGVAQGGYIDDTLRGRRDINDTRVLGGRAALAWAPDGGWRVTLSGTGQRIRGDDAQFADRDARPRTRRSPVAQPYRNDYLLADLVVTRDWGSGLRLVSATGIVRQTLTERYDSTMPQGRPTIFDQRTRISLLTSELRLSRTARDGGGWLIGASLVDNDARQNRQLGPPDAPLPIPGAANAVLDLTLFGEASLKLRPWLTGTAGARLAYTRVTGRPLDAIGFPDLVAPPRARTRTTLLPSAALVAEIDRGWHGFVRYQEGFRPGGVVASATFISDYRSDRVRTVEAGVRRGTAGRGAFDGQLALSWTRWTDIQADLVDFSGFPTTANIGDGRIWSVDARIGWRPLPGLSLEAAGLFNDSLVTNPLPGIILTPRAPLPNVARWNGRIGAEYRTDLGAGGLRLALNGRYVGTSRLGIGAILGEKQGDWFDLTALARFESGRHAVTLSATNLLDMAGNRFALGSPFTIVTNPQITPLVPRTLRIGWELRF